MFVMIAAIALFRRQLAIGLTHVVSKLGLMKGTIDRMPMSIRLVKAAAMDEAAKPVAAALSAAGIIGISSLVLQKQILNPVLKTKTISKGNFLLMTRDCLRLTLRSFPLYNPPH